MIEISCIILHILSEYVGDGLYNFLFSVGKDQTYKIEDKRLIVFELDEVKDKTMSLRLAESKKVPPYSKTFSGLSSRILDTKS